MLGLWAALVGTFVLVDVLISIAGAIFLNLVSGH